MAMKLVVVEAFAIRLGEIKKRFQKGDEITDTADVEAVLKSPQSHHVVKVNVVQTTIRAASKGAK